MFFNSIGSKNQTVFLKESLKSWEVLFTNLNNKTYNEPCAFCKIISDIETLSLKILIMIKSSPAEGGAESFHVARKHKSCLEETLIGDSYLQLVE